MITTKDIAKVLGISDSTVSRALNDHFHTSDEMKRRVRKVAKHLGYIPNAVARGLSRRRTKAMGLVFPYSLTDPFIARVYRGIENETLESGYSLFICQTNDDRERENMHLDRLKEKRVDGVVMVPASGNYVDDSLLRKSVTSFRKLEIPLVFIDKYLPGLDVDYVATDYEKLAFELMNHLIGLGHRRIGFIGGYDCTPIREGQRGYRRALADAGLAYEERLVKNAVLGRISPETWHADVIQELVTDGVTTVFMVAEKQVLELLRTERERREVERRDLVEFASLPEASRFWRCTARGRMPLEKMGSMAAGIIMQYLGGSKRTKQKAVVLPAEELVLGPATESLWQDAAVFR